MDARVIGERSDAVLRTAKPGHDVERVVGELPNRDTSGDYHHQTHTRRPLRQKQRRARRRQYRRRRRRQYWTCSTS
jgi:hypothetical protein